LPVVAADLWEEVLITVQVAMEEALLLVEVILIMDIMDMVVHHLRVVIHIIPQLLILNHMVI
jgi:hypothetical protein